MIRRIGLQHRRKRVDVPTPTQFRLGHHDLCLRGPQGVVLHRSRSSITSLETGLASRAPPSQPRPPRLERRMDVAFAGMTPSCAPSLHGPSRLSGAPPLADDVAPIFTEEEFQAMMLGDCALPSSSADDDLHSPLFSWDGAQFQFQAPMSSEDGDQLQALPFSVDDLPEPEFSEAEVRLLAPLFCDEEIDAVLALILPRRLQTGTACPDGQLGGKKRKQPSPPPSEEGGGDCDESGPPPMVPPPAKRARKNKNKRLRLQAWHRRIAARILRGHFRAPEPSRGRTALQCQCLELAGGCALHQDTPERAWMESAQGHVPLIGGPGEVLAPKLAAGDTIRQVVQYARWRRSVSMPTRFYVQRAVAREGG
ncbi:hypothetical protein ACP70R_014923 [Stipagrostis hirtigluma subsp. patula]